MANKFVVIPRDLYQGLLAGNKEDLQERAPLQRAAQQTRRILRKKSLSASEKAALYQQQLRGYLRLRQRAQKRPLRVRMEGAPGVLIRARAGTAEGVHLRPQLKQEQEGPLVLVNKEEEEDLGEDEEDWEEAQMSPPVTTTFPEAAATPMQQQQQQRSTQKRRQQMKKAEKMNEVINKLYAHVKEEPEHFGLTPDGKHILLSQQYKKPIQSSNTRESIEHIVRRLPGSPAGTTKLRQRLSNDPVFKDLMAKLSRKQSGEGIKATTSTKFRPAKWTS